ncbi:lysozyme inhibitor LprI family protein [Sphingomonas sp. RT2P30]|uniref:lysozyme inhibitor LprI family protein n=1 Tax=Parasphingomonas halimpatiens TaxID=3096162 RepID=UPI002FC6EAA4
MWTRSRPPTSLASTIDQDEEPMMKPMMMLALAIAGATLAPAAAQAASFDCARASAPDEKAICADRTLNDLDVKMTTLYDTDGHFMLMGARAALHDDQVAWLATRRACHADKVCLRKSYYARIAVLQRVIDDAARRLLG